MSSLLPRSKNSYKKNLPVIINTSVLVKLLFFLQVFTYVFIILVGLLRGNEYHDLTPSLVTQESTIEKRTSLTDHKSATGKSQSIYSLFEIINHNYPYKSIFFILTALISALKLYILSITNLIILKFFVDSKYCRLNYYAIGFTIVGSLKYVTWLILNYTTIEDSQGQHFKNFMGFLVFANASYYLLIFQVLGKNIKLFNTLIKSSNFNSGSLTFNKVFHNPYIASIVKVDYFKFLKILYFTCTVIDILLLRSFYYHQIADDLSYLNAYNFWSWVVLIFDLIFENFMVNLFGLGDGLKFWNFNDNQETLKLTITN